VEYQAKAAVTEKIHLNQANAVEEIRVVSDFPNVRRVTRYATRQTHLVFY